MSKNNGGVSGVTLLGIAFIVLKLTNVIAWSWFWVLSPLWFGIALLGVVFLIWVVVQIFKKEPVNKPNLERPRSKFAERVERARQSQINK